MDTYLFYLNILNPDFFFALITSLVTSIAILKDDTISQSDINHINKFIKFNNEFTENKYIIEGYIESKSSEHISEKQDIMNNCNYNENNYKSDNSLYENMLFNFSINEYFQNYLYSM